MARGWAVELYAAPRPSSCCRVEEIDAIFRRLSGWSIIERLNEDEFRSRINEACVAQPCIFAVQVGLAAVWRQWGIEPDLVVGHSVGEVAAAFASGVLSLENAVRVIYHRSRLQQTLKGQGRMLALGLPQEIAESLVARYKGSVSIAAVNSHSSVTLSGGEQELEDIRREQEAGQTFCRFLQVDVPYHGDWMDSIRDDFQESLAGIDSLPVAIPYYSTVTGRLLDDPQLDAEYWWRNVRQPVLFAAAVEARCWWPGPRPSSRSARIPCSPLRSVSARVAAIGRRSSRRSGAANRNGRRC